MIQRIQSVYLLAAFLLLEFAAFVLYVEPEIDLAGLRLVSAGLSAIVGLLALAAIFLFGNRVLQASVVASLRLITVIVIFALWLVLYVSGGITVVAAGSFLGIAGVLIAPVLAAIAMHLARKGIGHDIDLIRSMDRLR